VPQLPQFAPSPVVSAQLLEQAVSPAWHVHAPATQAWPAAHALPQVPQFDASVCSSTQPPPQVTNPAAQVGPAPALEPPLPDTAPFPPAPLAPTTLPPTPPVMTAPPPPVPPVLPPAPPVPPAPPSSSDTAGSPLAQPTAGRNESVKAKVVLKVRRRIGSTKALAGTVTSARRADSTLYPAGSKAGSALSRAAAGVVSRKHAHLISAQSHFFRNEALLAREPGVRAPRGARLGVGPSS
jgi:hypothetical protein